MSCLVHRASKLLLLLRVLLLQRFERLMTLEVTRSASLQLQLLPHLLVLLQLELLIRRLSEYDALNMQ